MSNVAPSNSSVQMVVSNLDIVQQICLNFEPKAIAICSSVSQIWYLALQGNFLWKTLCERDFRYELQLFNFDNNVAYKKLYQKFYHEQLISIANTLSQQSIIEIEKENTSGRATASHINVSQVAHYKFLAGVDIGRDFNVMGEHANIVINITESSSKKLLVNSLNDQLTQVLKSFYLTFDAIDLFITEIKMSVDRLYTNLTIIGNTERSEKKEQLKSNQIENQRILDYESIFESKKPIQLDTLFEQTANTTNQLNPKKIIIYGSAGIGKSTFCHYISYKWARKELWPQFRAIFWIKLRHLNKDRYPSSQDYTILDILSRESRFQSKDYASYLEDENFRNQCLIILDGYDEFFGRDIQLINSKGKFFPAVQAFQEDFDYILITTRPQKVKEFRASCEMEILGFEKEDIQKYINRFFPENKEKEKQKLLQLLKDPSIYSLSHIPINLEIFCSLAYDGKSISPGTTITRIYDELTDWLIKKYMIDKTLTPSQDIDDPLIKEHDKVRPVLNALADIAWGALANNRFYTKNTKDSPEISKIFKKYKLNINEVTRVGPFQIQDEEGAFIHPTFQEFFAAMHISHLYNQNKTDEIKKIVSQKKLNSRYYRFLSFVSGYLSENNPNAIQFFFDNLLNEPYDLAESQELCLIAECFEECRNSNQVKQYALFVNKVANYIVNAPIQTLSFNILRGKIKLINNDSIIESILENLGNFEQSEVMQICKLFKLTNRIFSEKIVNALIHIVTNLENSLVARKKAVGILDIKIKEGLVLKDEDLENLVSFAKSNNLGDGDRWTFIELLGSIALVEQKPLNSKALKGLEQLAENSDIDQYDRLSALYKIGVVAQGQHYSAKFALEALAKIEVDIKMKKEIEVIKLITSYLNGKDIEKVALEIIKLLELECIKDFPSEFILDSCIYTLNYIIKINEIYAEEIAHILINIANNSNLTLSTRGSTAFALYSLAKKINLSPKVIATYRTLAENQQLNYAPRCKAIKCLKESARLGLSNDEVLQSMRKITTERVDPFVRDAAIKVIKVIAEQKESIAREAKNLLEEIAQIEGFKTTYDIAEEIIGLVKDQKKDFVYRKNLLDKLNILFMENFEKFLSAPLPCIIETCFLTNTYLAYSEGSLSLVNQKGNTERIRLKTNTYSIGDKLNLISSWRD